MQTNSGSSKMVQGALNDLIFLGQIPGTNLYLSFYELEIIGLVVLLVAFARLEYRLFKDRRTGFNYLFVNAPKVRTATPPVQAIGRIGLTLPIDNDPAQ